MDARSYTILILSPGAMGSFQEFAEQYHGHTSKFDRGTGRRSCSASLYECHSPREGRPLVISHGDGIYVVDNEGNRYIEGLGGLFCASLGFSEKRLVDAAVAQMQKLPFYHSFGGKSHETAIELAERLIALAPVPMSKVFFANSGSEANDTAVKIVWYYHNAIGKPAKKKIISRIRAYHGVTVASAKPRGCRTITARSTCRSTAFCTRIARITIAMPIRARRKRNSRRVARTHLSR